VIWQAENDPEVSFLIDDLQLREQQQFPMLQNKRYIVRNGRPEMLPSNPLAILSTNQIFSAMAETTDPKHRKHSLGSVAVVGAGASGLAAAYRLKAAGVAVTVFETQNAVGGKIQSFSQNGLIWEKGPNTMAENDPEVSFLIDDLQLREQQQFVQDRHLI
jgi:NADPH-dependent 2,4-dienoyl-CoA reductase/sulfur reductase-like enzyme